MNFDWLGVNLRFRLPARVDHRPVSHELAGRLPVRVIIHRSIRDFKAIGFGLILRIEIQDFVKS